MKEVELITHVVLLKPKDGITEGEINAALDHVRELQHAIPGIVSVQADKNLNTSGNQGYTHGFVMQFVDAEHLKAYAPHPAHRVVSNELQGISKSIIDFDIEGVQTAAATPARAFRNLPEPKRKIMHLSDERQQEMSEWLDREWQFWKETPQFKVFNERELMETFLDVVKGVGSSIDAAYIDAWYEQHRLTR
jgi:hypothetical protein